MSEPLPGLSGLMFWTDDRLKEAVQLLQRILAIGDDFWDRDVVQQYLDAAQAELDAREGTDA